MQTPAGGRRGAHEKTRVSQTVWENTSFSHVVDILKNAQMAGTGFELVVVFRGKSYILSAAGDKLGIISASETR